MKTRNLKILTDLYDVDGFLVASAGSEITPALLRQIICKGAPLRKNFERLDRPFILEDIRAVMSEEITGKIFNSLELQEKVLKIVGNLKVQGALYREIVPLKGKSPYNYRHFLLIGALAAKMALDLKPYGYEPGKAFLYGLVHDIGKTRIADEILNKETPLTREEYEILHTHPIKSFLLLKYYLGVRGEEAARVGCTHHEKLDGSGYPQGIKTLSKYTKLIAIADIFDALVANRPYRKCPFSVRSALDRLIAEMDAGKLPKFPVRLLISYFRIKKENFRTMKISRKPREPEPPGNYGIVAK